jgi:putative membrane protein
MRYPLVLLVLFGLLAAGLAIAPHDRMDWALENALAFVAVGLLVATARTFRFSKVSYTSIFVLLALHEIGAHFTYSEVPYDAWIQGLTGWSLDAAMHFERNHYDRFVHFTYGLLIAYPIRAFVVRIADVRGFWGYFFPLDVIMSTSMLYELIEWAASLVFGGELGQAYLGTQGDEWDAQKDMLLATLGAILALTVTAIVGRALQRDFHREWAESWRVKGKQPLGEEAISRLRAENPS